MEWRSLIRNLIPHGSGEHIQLTLGSGEHMCNAIKFTREGKVGIKLYVIHDPCSYKQGEFPKITYTDEQYAPLEESKDRKCLSTSQSRIDQKDIDGKKHEEGCYQSHAHTDGIRYPLQDGASANAERDEYPPHQTTVWIRCDVYDTGNGISEKALSTLFYEHMQAGADIAQKYGRAEAGLAMCKQLVNLMGGQLTVSSREHNGSIFSFVLPYQVSAARDSSDDLCQLSEMIEHDAANNMNGDDDIDSGFFKFQPRTCN